MRFRGAAMSSSCMQWNSPCKKIFPLFALLMGGVYGFNIIGIVAIDPFNTAWQFNAHDSTTHFFGWEFFRNEPWSLPPGRIRSYLFPHGTSIVFTDSIPLAAFVLKFFNLLLPSDFQYFGIWRLLSYAMQGLIGYLLIFRVTKHEWSGLVGSVLFITAPIFAIRIPHAALQSHWLILYSLYLYLKDDSPRTRVLWGTLLTGSVLIHFYLFAMVLVVWGAHLAREGLAVSFRERGQLLIFVLFTLVLLALSMWGAGYFVSGVSAARPADQSNGALGSMSMNLNAPFNAGIPGGGKAGIFLPRLPTLSRGQRNGFCYLGGGVLLLALLSSLAILGGSSRYSIKRHLPLYVACVVLICFASSNVVTLGERVLFEIPLPELVVRKINIFRASGRFVWPVNYAIIIGGCAIIARRYTRQVMFLVICCVVAAQVIDLMPQHLRREPLFTNRPDYCRSPFDSILWGKFAKRYKHISFIPARFDWLNNQCDDYVHFARLAVKNGMTLNVGYVARDVDRTHYNDALAKQFTEGILPADTLYVLKDWAKSQQYATKKYPFVQGELNGFSIIVPYPAVEDFKLIQ